MSEKTPKQSGKAGQAPKQGLDNSARRDSPGPVNSGLLANISHELRTPIDAILGYTELLTQTQLDDTQQTFVGAIERAAGGLLDIVDDVLNLSRMEAGKLAIHRQPFSIRDCLDSVAQLLAPAAYRKGLDFVRLVDKNLPLNLIGDPLHIRQILINLVGNAIKFTDSGEVRVRISAHSVSERCHELVLQIADTGIGIKADEIPDLFKPFFQPARPQGAIAGTGLGLAISKALCEAMGGSISVQSKPGAGSTFSVRIPFESMVDESFQAGEGSDLLIDRRVCIVCADPEQSDWIADNLRLDGAITRAVAGVQQLASAISSSQCADDIVVSVVTAQDLVRFEELAEYWRPVRARLPILSLVSTVSGHALQQICSLLGGAAIPAHSSAATISNHIATLMQQHRLSPQTSPARGPGIPQPLAGLTLLVAEDNQFGRDYLQMLLGRHGATVDVCRDGLDACRMMAGNKYDLVLMDVRMPHCDGIEAMHKLKASGAPLPPVIGLTAAPEESCRALNAGMSDCLIKPVRPALLLRYINHYRDESTPPPSRPLSFIDDEMRAELNRELPQRAALLLNAIEGGKMSAALDAAHKINGTAALCGFAQLHATAASIEGLIRQEHLDGIERLTRDLQLQVDQALASLLEP